MNKYVFSFLLLFPFCLFSQIDCSKDTIAPDFSIVSLSSVLLDQSINSIDLYAIDFIKTAKDNCTPDNEIIYTFDEAYPVDSLINKEHYFCGKGMQTNGYSTNAQLWHPQYKSSTKVFYQCLVSQVEQITISAFDKKKNINSKNTMVSFVNIDNSKCSTYKTIVSTLKGENVNTVFFKLEGPLAELPKFYCGNSGERNYSYENTDLSLTGFKNEDPLNGITIQDLLLLRNHILGIKKLDSPYKIIAADVNGDGKISGLDITEMKKIISGFVNNFKNNKSWVLVPKNYVFTNVSNPLPEFYSDKMLNKFKILSPLPSESLVEFYAIKIGDLNFSAKP